MPDGFAQLPPAFVGAAAAWALLTLVLGVGLALAIWRALRLSSQLAAKQSAMDALLSKPKTVESRIEQYDILWYPVLTVDEKEKRIVKTAPGLPHCKNCAVRLKDMGKEWGCPKCEFRCAASVIDVVVMDSVIDRITKQYLQRHPDFSTPAQEQKA